MTDFKKTLILYRDDFKSKCDGYHLDIFQDMVDTLIQNGVKISKDVEELEVVYKG